MTGLIAATVLLAVAVTACGSADQASGPSRTPPAPTTAPVSGAPSASPSTPAPRTGPPATTPPATPPAAPEPPMTSPLDRRGGEGPADRPGDRVHGYRTLVGTIEAGEACPVLRVGADRWSLVGGQASTLAAGARVEVRGTVVTPPRGCHAPRALRVTQVSPRP